MVLHVKLFKQLIAGIIIIKYMQNSVQESLFINLIKLDLRSAQISLHKSLKKPLFRHVSH